jgi:hypothetical protein
MLSFAGMFLLANDRDRTHFQSQRTTGNQTRQGGFFFEVRGTMGGLMWQSKFGYQSPTTLLAATVK